MSFQELGLDEPIVRAVVSEGYTVPTQIQTQAIPHVLAGRDLMGCAQTGTGKTAAFALPILQGIDRQRRTATSRAPRVLVLSPTRELASQIGQSFAVYGRHLRFRQTVIYGGVSQHSQVRALSKGVHVLVATPGRLLDLVNQKHVSLQNVEVFVLDEADRMLDMGFMPDLKKIIALLPKQRQSLFFSATMQGKIAELANGLLSNPVRVDVSPKVLAVERIEQRVLFVNQNDKRALLKQVLTKGGAERVLIFTRTKRCADKVARQLQQTGIVADAIHGDKSQSARERALNRFRSGTLRVLVATDVAARGIDVDGVSHVINYDMPREPEAYVHRIGRTGRAGADGIALSFCDASERSVLRSIESLIRRSINVDSAHPFHQAAPAKMVKRESARRPGEGNRHFPKRQKSRAGSRAKTRRAGSQNSSGRFARAGAGK